MAATLGVNKVANFGCMPKRDKNTYLPKIRELRKNSVKIYTESALRLPRPAKYAAAARAARAKFANIPIFLYQA